MLDVEAERQKITLALSNLLHSGLASVEFIESGGLGDLQGILRRQRFHVFHYVGHGAFDEITEDGIILLEDEQGFGIPVSGTKLGNLLRDHISLRLVILNSCEGARSSRNDPFAGVATTLVQTGIPCVTAMQFEITDKAAIAFAKEFYQAIADNYPLDAAMSEARKAMDYSVHNSVEWGTPVMYMRTKDGVIFDISPANRTASGSEDIRRESSDDIPFSLPSRRHGIQFNPETGDLIVDGREIFLTASEAKLMKLLHDNAGLTCTKDAIAAYVWDYGIAYGGVSDEMISKLVNRLRRKIGRNYITTIRGRGYKLSA